MPSLDIETRRKTNREYYSRNKERIKQTQLARSKKYYEENKFMVCVFIICHYYRH